MRKFKEYLEYMRNKKIAKREMTKLMATTLPVVNELIENKTGIVKTIINLIKSCDGLTSDDLRKEFITGLAEIVHDTNKNA